MHIEGHFWLVDVAGIIRCDVLVNGVDVELWALFLNVYESDMHCGGGRQTALHFERDEQPEHASSEGDHGPIVDLTPSYKECISCILIG